MISKRLYEKRTKIKVTILPTTINKDNYILPNTKQTSVWIYFVFFNLCLYCISVLKSTNDSTVCSIRLQADFHGEYTVNFQANCRVLAHWLCERAHKERQRARERESESTAKRESKKFPAEFSNIIFIDYLMQKSFPP